MHLERPKATAASAKILRNTIFSRSGYRSKNDTDDQVTLIQIATDPDYYSPYEVSYRFSGVFSFAVNRARDKFFLERQIASIVPRKASVTRDSPASQRNAVHYTVTSPYFASGP